MGFVINGSPVDYKYLFESKDIISQNNNLLLAYLFLLNIKPDKKIYFSLFPHGSGYPDEKVYLNGKRFYISASKYAKGSSSQEG
jgi:hypothetical protein